MSLEGKYFGEKDKDYDPYCYKGTDILKNDLDIKDKKNLEIYERAVTSQRLLRLYIKPFSTDFSKQHYLGIHKYLFSGIYPFAGKTRTVDIMKGETYFARYQFIESELECILKEMKQKFYQVTTTDEYALLLAKFYIDLNLLHPFREGNGRCEREFLREYVEYLNDVLPLPPFELDYSKMNKGLLLVGTIENSDEKIKEEFTKALVEKQKIKKK